MYIRPIISIIIPIFNSEKHIDKCLESLLSQTEKNIEIICINDGSTDESGNILKKYKLLDSRIKIFSQQNNGPAAARNFGINNSSGEYIMFCDSDDFYNANMCELMLSTIQNKKVDLVICDSNLIKEYTNEREDADYYKLNIFGLHSLTNKNRLDINVVVWNKIFKRSIIKNNNIIFPNSFMGEDLSFVHQYIFFSKNIYGLDEVLYNYRLHDNSLMCEITGNSENFKVFCFQNIDAFAYTFNKLKFNNTLSEDMFFLLEAFYYQLQWLIGKNIFFKNNILDYANKYVLFDLDLEACTSTKNDIFYFNQIKNIKSKKYDLFIINKKENDTKKDKIKKNNNFLIFIKSYLLFPVYIYKSYKLIQSVTKNDRFNNGK